MTGIGRKWYEEIEPKHGVVGDSVEVWEAEGADQDGQVSRAAAQAVAMKALRWSAVQPGAPLIKTAGDKIVAPFWDAIAPEEAALKTAVGKSVVKLLLDDGDNSEALAKSIGEGMFGKGVSKQAKQGKEPFSIFAAIADGLTLGG